MLDTISVATHNDEIVRRVLWALDNNAPLTSIGCHVSDATAQLFRSIRNDLHYGTHYVQTYEFQKCGCPRCVGKSTGAAA
jgi:hypothetical protein